MSDALISVVPTCVLSEVGPESCIKRSLFECRKIAAAETKTATKSVHAVYCHHVFLKLICHYDRQSVGSTVLSKLSTRGVLKIHPARGLKQHSVELDYKPERVLLATGPAP